MCREGSHGTVELVIWMAARLLFQCRNTSGFFTPILNPPNCHCRRRKDKAVPRVIGEGIAIRQVVYISLTYDHRVLDGAEASRFLTTLKRFLEKEHGAFGLKV